VTLLESPLEGRHKDVITMLLNFSLRPTSSLVLVCRKAIASPLFDFSRHGEMLDLQGRR
jgi:hypothetical protein